jgi:HSP20 family protein
MFSLSRNLFNDLFSVHRDLDSLFERSWNSFGRALPDLATPWSGFQPEVACYHKDGNLVCRLAIPGVDAKNVDLSISGREVTIKGERTAPFELKDDNWLIQEFRYGQFQRSFRLPEGVDVDKVNATFNNGVLEITVPAGKAHLPRKIEIKQLGNSEEKAQLKASA